MPNVLTKRNWVTDHRYIKYHIRKLNKMLAVVSDLHKRCS